MLKTIKNTVIYHIYPLGFCGAINKSDNGNVINRLSKIDKVWIEHFKSLGINAIYFGPIFESSYHGYDTIDYFSIDKRLGTNDDFKNLVKELHSNGIKVVVDGVFNHVGREFWAFKDVRNNKQKSKYVSWFNINFNGNSNYNDGFYYDGWEGHYELVKLNLNNREVRNHIFDAIKMWVNDFDIDGIRLDVAYCLEKSFIEELRNFCNNLKDDLWLLGEIISGDYNNIAGTKLLYAVTNYELYKGLYSSHNDKNYFEINYSLNREVGEFGIYKNFDLYNFVDNHDVNRIASVVNDKRYLNNIYALLFTIPGIPSIYYGSEWGIEGDRKVTDLNLRPELFIEEFKNNFEAQKLEKYISRLINIRKENKELTHGNYKEVLVRNKQLVFQRSFEGKSIFVALNLDDKDEIIEIPVSKQGNLTDILNNDKFKIINNKIKVIIPSFSCRILKEEV